MRYFTLCSVVGCLCAASFSCAWRPYPFADGQTRCHSQNGEFYVVRYTTSWRRLFPNVLKQEGTAFLFNSAGDTIHQWPAYFGPDSGPYWSDGDGDALVSHVYFMGDESPLVTVPGRVGGDGERSCYALNMPATE